MEQNPLTIEISILFTNIFKEVIDGYSYELIDILDEEYMKSFNINTSMETFDGTIGSVILCDSFWDDFMAKFVHSSFIFRKINEYDFKFIDKTNDVIKEILEKINRVIEVRTMRQIDIQIWNYIMYYWRDILKDVVRADVEHYYLYSLELEKYGMV